MWDQVVKKKVQNNLYLQSLSEFILSHMKPRHSNPIKRLGIPRDSIREASCWAWQDLWVTGVTELSQSPAARTWSRLSGFPVTSLREGQRRPLDSKAEGWQGWARCPSGGLYEKTRTVGMVCTGC